MPFEYEALREQAQKALVEFLIAQLSLGSSFVHAASIACDAGHITHYEEAKKRATKSADIVRRLMSTITDGKVRADIDKQLTKLDQLIAAQ